MLQQDGGRRDICKLINSADISIVDIGLASRKAPGQRLYFDLATGKAEVRNEEMEQHQVLIHHRSENGEVVFDLADESGGTRTLLFLAGPILDILRKGLTLVIDELDTSLHTLLVRELVRSFHRPEINTGKAQLIFSTHDTALMSAPGLLRRDQVWVVEKDASQASSLASLVEFSPRKNEAIERGYLTGRYGGVPLLDLDSGLAL